MAPDDAHLHAVQVAVVEREVATLERLVGGVVHEVALAAAAACIDEDVVGVLVVEVPSGGDDARGDGLAHVEESTGDVADAGLRRGVEANDADLGAVVEGVADEDAGDVADEADLTVEPVAGGEHLAGGAEVMAIADADGGLLELVPATKRLKGEPRAADERVADEACTCLELEVAWRRRGLALSEAMDGDAVVADSTDVALLEASNGASLSHRWALIVVPVGVEDRNPRYCSPEYYDRHGAACRSGRFRHPLEARYETSLMFV
ncbi:hypothetical protein ZEAMMB73_Zm00001d050459 [Zea mays]|uniref:Uncharacterized protein n=1 Tax=Zea mays TaxID=4577 RepID=A0A1D6Q1R1_MAIZE|nr:hypothetical protein ZEAMMB73_Zm00001d050459 [Zea mays]